jgi:polygalacturonase
VIYLEAGVYTAENCELITYSEANQNGVTVYTPVLHVPSGKTLYLSGGAVVQAMVHFNGCENSSVRGRGVVDHYPWNRANNIRASEPKPYPAGIRVENSKNVLVEGVIVRNAQAYSIYAGNTVGLTVDNFKCISAAQWSDGFDSMATSDVVIKNSFFRTNDDCIAIYGSCWNNKGDSRNYEIYDCVLWADNAHAINMGNNGSNNPSDPDIIENIYFHDIEILEVHSINWTGAFSVMCGGENILRNVTVERFNVAFTKSDLIRLRFTMDGEHYGSSIENFVFRDIYFAPREGQRVGVYLQAHSKWRAISGIRFENVYIGNEKLTARSSLLHKSDYVSKLTFE